MVQRFLRESDELIQEFSAPAAWRGRVRPKEGPTQAASRYPDNQTIRQPAADRQA
ncbi:hypothetical protein LC612_43045 [Nostoc sp. CHAB 5834]|nr:hypothetical protein [Nostoc sp. CHAB 5834]